jgi:hypothetical protein
LGLGFAPEVIVSTITKEYYGHSNPGEQSYIGLASHYGVCGHQQTNIQLYTQQVTGFSGDSQPYLPVLACPFLLLRYSYRYCYIGVKISGYLDFLRGKAYPASIGEFSPLFPSFLFRRLKGSEGEKTRHPIVIVNSQFEFCCLSWGQVIYSYLGGGDTEVNALSQSKRRQEDDQ